MEFLARHSCFKHAVGSLIRPDNIRKHSTNNQKLIENNKHITQLTQLATAHYDYLCPQQLGQISTHTQCI